MDFASDNVTGASGPVLRALIEANDGTARSYGGDDDTARARDMLADLFEHETSVWLVATGTAANALALAALTPPWGAVFCHEDSHIMVDECGAPEMFSAGAKLIGIPGVAGRVGEEDLRAAIADHPRGVMHQVQPAALSLSQTSEAGTLYSLDQIRSLCALAHAAGLRRHMDGARFANAAAALGVSPADMTWRAGIDVISFGATKNGCLACEAVVFFDTALAEDFAFRCKRAGHILSKSRFLGAQMRAYLADGHWLDNARHANAMAAKLAEGLGQIPGVRMPWPCEANEVFAVLPEGVETKLRANGFGMTAWRSRGLPTGFELGTNERLTRFVTAFSTSSESIARLLDSAACAGQGVAP